MWSRLRFGFGSCARQGISYAANRNEDVLMPFSFRMHELAFIKHPALTRAAGTASTLADIAFNELRSYVTAKGAGGAGQGQGQLREWAIKMPSDTYGI